MLRQEGLLLLLSLCISLSYQICHNGICDTDRCGPGGNLDCPSCYECDEDCGTCGAIPNCCTSHPNCDHYDGICDTEVNPTTCSYCDFNAEQCKPGCITDNNCQEGFVCISHSCKPNEVCTDDAYCNTGPDVICDVGNDPYTTCFYCQDGKCLPGCVKDDNCPEGYTCDISQHKCSAPAGSVLIESITVQTKKGCSDCSGEGVVLSLLGKTNSQFPNGIPCTTQVLDHKASNDYDGSGGSSARFDGTLGGVDDVNEIAMMGGCYKGPLKAEMTGGSLLWKGTPGWEPDTICVDWQTNNFAWQCKTTKDTGAAKKWNLFDCHSLTPKIKCSEVYP